MRVRDEKTVRLRGGIYLQQQTSKQQKRPKQTHQPKHTTPTPQKRKKDNSKQTTTTVAAPLTICNLCGELLATGQVRGQR